MPEIKVDPATIEGSNSASVDAPVKKANALSGLSRSLCDDDLSSPGARKLLLERLDRLELENLELKDFVQKFHNADKEVAVLRENKAKTTTTELLYSAALSVGSIFLGMVPAISEKLYFWPVTIASIALIVIAILARYATMRGTKK